MMTMISERFLCTHALIEDKTVLVWIQAGEKLWPVTVGEYDDRKGKK